MNVYKRKEYSDMADLIKTLTEQYMKAALPEMNVGDTVRLMETRPLSKTKRWRLVEIIEKAK